MVTLFQNLTILEKHTQSENYSEVFFFLIYYILLQNIFIYINNFIPQAGWEQSFRHRLQAWEMPRQILEGEAEQRWCLSLSVRIASEFSWVCAAAGECVVVYDCSRRLTSG